MKIKNWRSLKLNGKKVFLRPLRKTDAQRIFELINDPEVTVFLATVEAPVSLEEEKAFAKRSELEWQKGKAFHFAIGDKKSGRVVGTCSLFDYNTMHHRAEAGIWIAKEHWKKGFGSEAISLLLDFGFQKLKLHRIRYAHIVQNKGSKGIAQKLGFKKEGFARDVILKRGKYWNAFIYSILENEWKKKTNSQKENS